MAERISKFEAANRQINAAIRLHFDGEDSVVIHTLAVAAANIYADVIDKKTDVESWRERIRKDNGMSHAEVRNVLHKNWNFFKHGDRDSEGVIEFDAKETDHLLFLATLECGELANTSTEMQIFQLWYLASGAFKLDADAEIQQFSEQLFPGLEQLTRCEQLQSGKEVLIRQLEEERVET